MTKAKCLWFTGIPCSGKTTLAYALKKHFPNSKVLDGDEIRKSPLADFVGFTPEDRANHIRRMGYLAKMFVDEGITVLCSFVSPNRKLRNEVREMFADDEFLEIYLNPSLTECSKRDVKGMYAKAKAGKIKNFTGLTAPYEVPDKPDLTINTEFIPLRESCQIVMDRVGNKSIRWELFIGRWNGVFHNGHDAIIQTKLKLGKHVLMAVRDVAPDKKNPWTAAEVKEMLEYRWKDEPKVKVIIIPDIAAVNYGRGVGYGVEEIKVVSSMQQISGTQIREMINKGNNDWHSMVPQEIVDYLTYQRR